MKLEKISYNIMKNIIRIGITVVLCFGLLLVCRYAYRTGEKVFSDDGVETAPGTSVMVTIPKGATISSVADMLESYGLIEDKKVFKVQCKLYDVKESYNAKRHFIPGDYTLNTCYNAEVIINILINGPGSESAISNGETYVPPETTVQSTK